MYWIIIAVPISQYIGTEISNGQCVWITITDFIKPAQTGGLTNQTYQISFLLFSAITQLNA
jgi:hypothetical protein